MKKQRQEIKRLLSLLEDHNRNTFMLMYSHQDLKKDINLVVDEMPTNKVKWALAQCQNSYNKVFEILKR